MSDQAPTLPPSQPAPPQPSPPRFRRRWIVLLLALFFFAFVVAEVLDPFGEKAYAEISHGDHTHYIPEDRDPNISISDFPTTPPGPNERITPDGRIVPR